ncbi:hypothetical protein PHJA_002399100 [Phtheirospermum japonicum]|uniref:Uncharacterized protein n=1 Tax=Phtheirospermum japonicum TaxID=374723 RepID=A0A830CRP9_9LAMI|nr:hypothetical protein PHJA_002399100 [Phtheirospermum japonicum]
MAETKSTHIVEIPVDDEHKQKKLIISAIQNHPLAEISQSPGHFLLLKLWQRDEDLSGRRLSRKESRKDAIGREIFQLCCFFFVFHGLFFTILFTASSTRRCGKWWAPGVVSACTSLAFVFLVQLKLCGYWKVERQLGRERAEGRALTRCVQELRMKGASFDLSKEPGMMNGKRLKSSSVEITWRPLTWCSHYRVTLLLLCFTGLALPSCRFVLCA